MLRPGAEPPWTGRDGHTMREATTGAEPVIGRHKRLAAGHVRSMPGRHTIGGAFIGLEAVIPPPPSM